MKTIHAVSEPREDEILLHQLAPGHHCEGDCYLHPTACEPDTGFPATGLLYLPLDFTQQIVGVPATWCPDCLLPLLPHTAVLGLWDPAKSETYDPESGEYTPANDPFRWMEWWPSMRAAHQSMRQRLYIGGAQVPVDRALRLFRPNDAEAQWGGNTEGSALFLYQKADPGSRPYAMLHFTPRGALTVTPLATTGGGVVAR